jgi:hypothetical protein
MLSAIRRQLNPATVMAFVALVFATTGGAFAVTSRGGGGGNGGGETSATTAKSKSKSKSTGKPGPRGPAGPKGETGAAGPAGPVGPAGAKGEAGARGENGAAGTSGTNGKDGESVASTALSAGEGGCAEGGSAFTASGKTTTACNGERGEQGEPGPEGKAGFTKELPGGATETGTWGADFQNVTKGTVYYNTDAVSFPIPLPIALEKEHTHYVTLEEQQKQNGKTAPAECQGTVEKPTAAKGTFCVYEGEAAAPTGVIAFLVSAIHPPGSLFFSEGVGTVGAELSIEYRGPEEEIVGITGTWAVTAP